MLNLMISLQIEVGKLVASPKVTFLRISLGSTIGKGARTRQGDNEAYRFCID